MRTLLRVLAAAAVCAGPTGAVFAQARGDALQPNGGSAVTFRLASPTATEGMDPVQLDGGATFYVTPRALLAGADVTSSAPTGSGTSAAFQLTLTREGAARLADAIERLNAEHLAVYVRGKVSAVGSLSFDADRGRATISGVSSAEVDQVARALQMQPVAPTAAIISVLPRETAVAPGGIVVVDVVATGFQNLRGYQVGLKVGGGASGRLDVETLHIEVDRPDYVFGTLAKFDAVDTSGKRLGGVLMSGGVQAQEQLYFGTFELRASADASGTFDVSVERAGRTTVMSDNTNHLISFSAPAASVTVGKGLRTRTIRR